MSSEAALIALAAAIYLFDCVVLLERGQALWARAALSFGSIHYQVRGRAVALLNPFTPFVPAFRTLPLFSPVSKVKASGALRALTPLVAPSAVQFVLVFLALPWCLYRAPGWPFFVALVLAYANAVLMLAVIAWRFGDAGIARRPLIVLGFGWLVCLPLSLNCMRKAGLSFDVAMDARQAIRSVPSNQQATARADLSAQIAEAMQELEESDARHSRLAELMRQLHPEANHGRF